MTLKDIFDNTNSWLKYAEAKHTVLLGFIGAGFFGIHNFVKGFCSWNLFFQIWIVSFIICLVISCLIALMSFMPILYPLKKKKSKRNQNLNPIYFKDIALTEANELLKMLNEETNENIKVKLAEQIIINSRITVYKFRLFTISIWLVFIGIIPPISIIALIIMIFKFFKNDTRKSNSG